MKIYINYIHFIFFTIKNEKTIKSHSTINITDNNNGTITVVSNTKWILSVDGNFEISKTSSSGSIEGNNQTFDSTALKKSADALYI